MLRFRLRQLRIPSLGRYLIPLPKLSDANLSSLSRSLEGRGFTVRRGADSTRRVALKGTTRITIDGWLGLATSAEDLLDALGPSIPAIDLRRKGATVAPSTYFSVKRSGRVTQLQFFPRAESSRTWTGLRTEGVCGLTPDEAAVLRRLLAKSSSSKITCVSAQPREGSKALQTGRRLYYRSELRVGEFLSSLGTIDSEGLEAASYLPRDSVMEFGKVKLDTTINTDEVGEWCPIS